jgi:anti-anti-sigma factor
VQLERLMTTQPPPFEIQSAHAAGVLTVGVSGEVDMATAPALGQAIEGTSELTTRVIVDLSGVTFLDSSALNMLVVAKRALAGRGVELRVVSPLDRAVRRVFEITHLTADLSVVDSVDDARA